MNFVNFAKETAVKAGKLILKKAAKKFKIDEKGKNDYVTSVDIAAEKLIIKEIRAKYPDHGILAEESSKDPESSMKFFSKYQYIWIIDPLDGTLNFTHGLPIYAVSIGLFQNKRAKSSKNFDYLEGELIAGAVFAPALGELFYASKGKGAYLNGKKIHVSKEKKLAKALSATGFPPVHKGLNLPYFIAMNKATQAVRRLGSAALDLCYTAAGRFGVFWEFGLSPWDIAAGALILSEAGGHITDTNGNPLDLFGKDLLATNKILHKETVQLLSKI